MFAREVPVTGGHSVKSDNFAATPSRLWFRTEVEFNCFPCVAALRLQTQSCRGFIATVHHAIFAAAVTRHPIDDAVSVPLRFLEQFRVARVMPVGHEIAGPFPPANISRWNRPGRTGQIPFAGEK